MDGSEDNSSRWLHFARQHSSSSRQFLLSSSNSKLDEESKKIFTFFKSTKANSTDSSSYTNSFPLKLMNIQRWKTDPNIDLNVEKSVPVHNGDSLSPYDETNMLDEKWSDGTENKNRSDIAVSTKSKIAIDVTLVNTTPCKRVASPSSSQHTPGLKFLKGEEPNKASDCPPYEGNWMESDASNSVATDQYCVQKKVEITTSCETINFTKLPTFGSSDAPKRKDKERNRKFPDRPKLGANFRRINITKKVFVRGHKKVSASNIKRKKWKSMKKPNTDSNQPKTVKHPGRSKYHDFNSELIDDDFEFPNRNLDSTAFGKPQEPKFTLPSSSGVSHHKKQFFDLENDDQIDSLMKSTIIEFGHKSLKPVQKNVIWNILRGRSTLLLAYTGFGKSLCYLMPAYIYGKANPGSISLCISPLISLMTDQIAKAPSIIGVECLHCGMSEKQKNSVISKILSKKVCLLFISPETFCSTFFEVSMRNIPINFVCIDEAHCISQWSHNFRPSYLQLNKVIDDTLKLKTKLGITATASVHSLKEMGSMFNVDPSNIFVQNNLPPNLLLTVSKKNNKEESLLNLLKSDQFKEYQSIIIYCTRRHSCDQIAALIRSKMKNQLYFDKRTGLSKPGNSTLCEAYHAGLSETKRRKIQNLFLSGKLRIIVSTIAFGMGIDKSDIRSVIHFDMPKSIESYVQEIGRSGRDGNPAHCHLFLDLNSKKEINELRRQVYSNHVDRPTLRSLISKIFKPCMCPPETCTWHEVSFGCEDAITTWDLTRETILTLLCLLELCPKRKWIHLLKNGYQMCKVWSSRDNEDLGQIAKNCPALQLALDLDEKRNDREKHYIEFNIINVAWQGGWDSADLKRQLRSLEWTKNLSNGTETYSRTGVVVEFSELAFRVKAPGNLSNDELDDALNYMTEYIARKEKIGMFQIWKLKSLLDNVCIRDLSICTKEFLIGKSNLLKSQLETYFNEIVDENSYDFSVIETHEELLSHEKLEIREDIRKLLLQNTSRNLCSRSIAKILLGISTPNQPAYHWNRSEFWGKQIDQNYHELIKLAFEEQLCLQIK